MASAELFGFGETEDLPLNLSDVVINATVNDTYYFQGYTPDTLADYYQILKGWITEDTNASNCDDGEYLDGDGECYDFNNSVGGLLASVYHQPSSVEIENMDLDDGNLTSLFVRGDDNILILSEQGGSPSWVTINWTNMTNFNFAQLTMRYQGNHDLHIGIWDCDEEEYEYEYGEVIKNGYVNYQIPVLDVAEHLCGGNVSIRFNHDENGNPSDVQYYDYASLVDGWSVGGTIRHDEMTNLPWGESGHENTGNLNNSLYNVSASCISINEEFICDWNEVNNTDEIVWKKAGTTITPKTKGDDVTTKGKIVSVSNIGDYEFGVDFNGSSYNAEAFFRSDDMGSGKVLVGGWDLDYDNSGETRFYNSMIKGFSFKTTDYGETDPEEFDTIFFMGDSPDYSTGYGTPLDNFKEWFGASQDASMYYDGSDLVINPKEVGSGTLQILGSMLVDDNLQINDTILYDSGTDFILNRTTGGSFRFYNGSDYSTIHVHDVVEHSHNATQEDALSLFLKNSSVWDVWNNETDYSKPIKQSYEKEVCEMTATIWNETIKECYNETRYEILYPYTKLTKGISTGQRQADIIQAFNQLNQNINLHENYTEFEDSVLAEHYITNTTKDPATLTKIETFYNLLSDKTYQEMKDLVLTDEGKLSGDVLFNYEKSDVGSYNLEAIGHTNRAMSVLMLWKIAKIEDKQNQQLDCWDLTTQSEIVNCMRAVQ